MRGCGLKALGALGLMFGMIGCVPSSDKVELGAMDGSTVEIIKSSNDARQYQHHSLPNGLRILLVSDPASQKAAASLDVAVGSADDPRDREGLAHFLEHMLFLGTEKFPAADDYQKFVAQQGGSHNAYTSPEHTNYFFDVKASALPEALDRFAQFFVAPLFTPEYVARERNAVHSEYRAKIKDSYRRERDVFREITDRAHPMSKFTVGNLDTLADRDGRPVRDDLLAFYNDFYSSERMTLVVLGRESIAELEAMVLPLFSQVPQREAKAHIEQQALFSANRLPLQVNIKSEKQEQRLDLLFPVASAKTYYREKPLQYLGHLLGHEGEGSLFSVLKQRGWVESLAAGANASGLNQGWFEVAMQLTRTGYEHRDEIIALALTSINQIKRQGLEAWRFDEQQQLADIAFQFSEKGEAIHTVSALASQMHHYPVSDVLRGSFIFDRYDQALIERYLDALNADNMVAVITSPDEIGDQQSRLYGTPYRVAAMEKYAASDLAATTAGLLLPQANPFIPKNLGLKDADSSALEAVPQKLEAFTAGALWHQQDAQFKVPKANLQVRIKTPKVGKTVESVVLSRIYASLVNDQLNEFSYPALLAGLYFNFSANTRGFDLSLGGYSDRQDALLERVLNVAQRGAFELERFEALKQEQLKGWRNARQLTPYRQLFQKIPAAVFGPYWENADLIAALERLEFSDLQAFSGSLWQGATLTALSHGNIDAAQAQALAQQVADKLTAPGAEAAVEASVVDLQKGVLPHVSVAVDHDDVAAALYVQPDSDSLQARVTMSLLQQSLKSSFFHELRTQQQLGYIVFVTGMNFKDMAGSLFVVQSPSAGLPEVVEAINAFLEKATQEGEDFDLHRQALIQQIEEPPKNLLEQTSRYWGALVANDLEFDDRQRMVTYLRRLTETQFKRQVAELLGDPQAMWFTASREPVSLTGATPVTELHSFKRSAPVLTYP